MQDHAIESVKLEQPKNNDIQDSETEMHCGTKKPGRKKDKH